MRALARRFFLPTFRRLQARDHHLNYLFLELTQACNVACLHCGSDCVKDASVPPIAPERVLRTLREIASRQDPASIMIAVTGGEPLCYPGVFELGTEISQMGFRWGMVTNGYAWDERTVAAARASGLGSLTVSLDGLEEAHDWLRGHAGAFQRALNTLRLVQAEPFLGALDVVTCVNRRNLHQLDEVRALLESLKVPAWRIFTIWPIGRAARNPELLLDPTEFQFLMEKLTAYRREGGIAVAYSEDSYLGRHECIVRDEPYFCRAGINIGGIMANGDILACPNIDRGFAQGNIHSESFMDVWEQRFQVFRDRRWMKCGECVGCEEWRMCEGEAFHLRDPKTKETRYCHVKRLGLQRSPRSGG